MPEFGCSGNIEEEHITDNADRLELQDGFDKTFYSLKFGKTLTRRSPSSWAQYYGIGKSDDTDRNSLGVNLSSVTLTARELATDPHEIATEPGVSPDPGDKLVYTDGLIVKGVEYTLEISGYGTPPTGMRSSNKGDLYQSAITIKPAIGDITEICFPENSNWYVENVDIKKDVKDWQTFTVRLVRYVGNTVANAYNNMLASPMVMFTEAENDAISSYWSVERRITFSEDARPELEETITYYDDDSSPT